MLGQAKPQPFEKSDLMVAKEPPVGVRFPREVKQALEKLAKDDDRTLSYIINKIVTEYLRAQKLIK
jgi:predicted DNA-binding protein